MADPFGILGLIDVIGQIAQVAVNLGLDWKDAPTDTKRFLTELRTLKAVLFEALVNILANEEFNNAFDGRHSTLLAQVGDTTKPTKTSSMLLKDLTKQAQGHQLAKKTREPVENLQHQCATLNSFMAIDALALGARIYKEVIETREEVIDTREEQQARQAKQKNKVALDWITTVDYSTGQWLLGSTKYQQWIETAKQTLFCPGIPGAGKTILTSIVVEDLRIRFRDDVNVGITYIYCNFRRQADQKVEYLLSTLIIHLSQDQSSLPDQFLRVFIVIDALDECQLSDGRSKTGASIFVTSRFILDVTQRFKDNLSLEIRAQLEDVQRYIEGNMAGMPTCVEEKPGLRKEIITKIVQAVDGMFLLAQLHLDSFKGKTTPKAIRAALKTLHKGSQAYDHAYNDAMDRIQGQIEGRNKELAKKVLSWIICAKRPLSITELQIALGAELNETELDHDNIPLVQDIVSEYFVGTWKQWFKDAQADITDTCAKYLSFDSFKSGSCHTVAEFEDRLRLNQFYDYAARYWGEHAREAGRTSQTVLDFLKNHRLVEAQVQGMMTTKSRWSYSSYCQEFPKRMQGLHVAAYFGILEAVETLLHSSNNNVKDSFSRTPLLWTAKNGHEAVVKVLLNTGKVGTDSKDMYDGTPLSYAAENRHKEVATMLRDDRPHR
ncbi:hypothetical protein C7999DRAFT_44830 [Corynascus novoguineensis]|uniref:NACHT domain-containing protein n=1 Tax=Corynascus novoguineensis TaxID=1126955 RepID=A0AAN7CJM8_9PEZI|nr:hypothetical protein C7999DRAFT_44830 [Corynascus novoguineensis]